MKFNFFTKILGVACVLFIFCGCKKGDNTDGIVTGILDESKYLFTHNQKNYALIKEAKTWLSAVAYAVEDGGYLAEVNSEEEQNAIFNALVLDAELTFDQTYNQFGFAAVWLGGNDLATEGTWVWNGNNDATEVQFWQGEVNGTPINGLYNNWGNEPDNNGDQDALCIGLEATPINAAGLWTDLDGTSNQLFFLIEYD